MAGLTVWIGSLSSSTVAPRTAFVILTVAEFLNGSLGFEVGGWEQVETCYVLEVFWRGY